MLLLNTYIHLHLRDSTDTTAQNRVNVHECKSVP